MSTKMSTSTQLVQKAFWERLLAGDDYIQWTLRFGCILHDDGILQAASDCIEEKGLTPSAERKLIQARRGLGLAQLVLESGDMRRRVSSVVRR